MEYRAVRISDIMGGINRDYFLPAIQREFVWETDQIEKLFDSIMGDYPIGSFLFWKVDDKNKEQWTTFEFIRQFDTADPHNPEANLKGISRDILLVLDGQQRMTSLYIGLKGSYRYFHYRWRTNKLYLNLLKRPIPNEADPQELIHQFKFRESQESNGEANYGTKSATSSTSTILKMRNLLSKIGSLISMIQTGKMPTG